ncbi:hypothetical protein D3C80_1153310 [compost metagenome]
MRRHHQLPGYRIGCLCATTLAYQMQAAVDAGGGSCRSDDIVVIHVQHVLVYGDLRIALQEVRHPPPMGGCRSSIEQPGCRQNKCPHAQPDQSGSARMGTEQGID